MTPIAPNIEKADITPVLTGEQVARLDPKYLVDDGQGGLKPPAINGTLQTEQIFPHGPTRRYALTAGTIAANVGLAGGDPANDAARLAVIAEDLMGKPMLQPADAEAK